MGNLDSVKYLIILLLFLIQCSSPVKDDLEQGTTNEPYLIVLGNVQDAGTPQAGCQKSCCTDLFENPDPTKMVVSLGLVEAKTQSSWLFEATPDLPRQMKMLAKEIHSRSETPNGIFLTHAHIGHYTGLMFLGHESMGAENVSVYAMPRMKEYLEENGPWNQLISFNNITINSLGDESKVELTDNLSVTPFLVPHRDEYSETVGYKISGPNKSAIFIPDIDKWRKWQKDISSEIASVDYAFLDATFFDGNEVNRDMSEIGHPFVVESLELFKNLSVEEKAKIHFIHFNHTNPLLNPESAQSKLVLERGFKIARFKDRFGL